ncbi:MAG: hypothetical protein IJF20_07970 [Clostridia bacterium]|nr:hypothetical protein [Clostridia bacterium]
MDENKEKDLLGEEAEETAETLTEQEKEEVAEILGNSGDETAVTTDWDGLAQLGDGEEFETEISEEESEEGTEDFSYEILCEKCGKRERYTELDEDYPYCKACRESMKKTRMNGWGVFFFISVLLACVIYLVYGISLITISLPVVKGDMYMAEKKYSSAIACYEETLATIDSLNQSAGGQVQLFDAGDRTYAKLVKAYYLLGSPTYAQEYYSALEQSGALEKFTYKETKGYYDTYDKMMDTYSEIQTLYAQNINTLYAAEKKADISEVKDELKALEELKGNKKYDKQMIAYFQYLFCSVTENSLDEGIKYLEEVKAGGRAYEFIYAIELCSLYLEKGEYEKAEKICYDSLEASPENIGVYQYLMMSKRRQGDYEGALKLAKEAEKAAETMYVPEGYETAMHYAVPMEQAIVYALMGEEDKAIAAIDKSFELGNDNSNLNISILLHYLYHVKSTEPQEGEDGEKIYDSVDEIYDQCLATISYYGAYYGLSVSENIQAIMDGEKTLEDVFVKGEVNWQ